MIVYMKWKHQHILLIQHCFQNSSFIDTKIWTTVDRNHNTKNVSFLRYMLLLVCNFNLPSKQAIKKIYYYAKSQIHKCICRNSSQSKVKWTLYVSIIKIIRQFFYLYFPSSSVKVSEWKEKKPCTHSLHLSRTYRDWVASRPREIGGIKEGPFLKKIPHVPPCRIDDTEARDVNYAILNDGRLPWLVHGL